MSTVVEIIEQPTITVEVTSPTQTVFEFTEPAPVQISISNEQGPVGPATSLSVGATTVVNPNVNPSLTVTGSSPIQSLNFSLPRASVISATGSTVNPNVNPSVSTSTTDGDKTFTFSLPRAATTSIGTVTTNTANSSASVTNTGINGDVTLNFTIPRGDTGGIKLEFDTDTANSNPGSGKFKYNNSTIGSVTNIYINNSDYYSNNITGWLASLDDSITNIRGILQFTTLTGNVNVFKINSTVTVSSGYYVIPVEYVSGTLPSDGTLLSAVFAPSGQDGDLSIAVGDARYVQLTGSTMTGILTLDDDPTTDLEAATKRYVDEIAQGLHSAPSARAATTANLTATYSNGTLGVGATLTATSNGAWEGVDGITVAEGYTWNLYEGVLVKNQSNNAQNGRYFISDLGSVSTPWVLTRCTFCDTSAEVPGTFVFVEDGDTLKATGWVAIVENPETFTIGTDYILFTQFSGAGSFIAGTGIDIAGTTISVEIPVANQTGNSGKYLTTDGTDTSWESVDALPLQSGNAGKYLTTDGTDASWAILDLSTKADKLLSTNAQVASYTLVLSDADKMVEMNVGSANNLTVPLNSSVAYSVGTQINILQTGAGQTTIVATGGVTINATPGLKLRAQWSSATLIKRATDTWVAIGDLIA